MLVVIAAGLIAAGCGREEGTPSRATSAASSAAPDVAPDPAASEERGPADPALAASVARAAIATGRRLDDLSAAFAPVSARVNFLVAADTLRRDAIDSEAGAEIERERAGAVRLEVLRMRPILVTARRQLSALVQPQARTKRVQLLLLSAISSRLRALDRLEAVLDAEQRDVSDESVDDLDSAFRTAWDDSLRATREATTSVQEIRSSLGLDPAPEEALR